MYQWQDSNGVWHTESGTRDDSASQPNADPNAGTQKQTGQRTRFDDPVTGDNSTAATRGPTDSLDPNIPNTGDNLGPANGQELPISSQNYDWGGSGTGAADDIFQLGLQNDAAQQRTGVKIDNYDANEQFANALKARQNQQYLAGLYNQQLTGQGPSAANLGGQQSLDQAIAAQHGAGLGASYGGGNAMLASNAQFAGARGAEVNAAATGYGGTVTGMRGGDISTMGLHQQQAYRQAQLEAAQRARNDAMAQFYVNQQNQIAADQLHAREAYQAQRDSNANYETGMYDKRQQRRQDQFNNTVVDYANLIGGTASAGGAQLDKGNNNG